MLIKKSANSDRMLIYLLIFQYASDLFIATFHILYLVLFLLFSVNNLLQSVLLLHIPLPGLGNLR